MIVKKVMYGDIKRDASSTVVVPILVKIEETESRKIKMVDYFENKESLKKRTMEKKVQIKIQLKIQTNEKLQICTKVTVKIAIEIATKR